MSLQLVEQLQQKAVPVTQMCRVLGVSRSGYYTARKRDQAQPWFAKPACTSRLSLLPVPGPYGSRRLRTAVASQGIVIGIYRLRRLMRKHRLRSVWKRKFVHTTGSSPSLGSLGASFARHRVHDVHRAHYLNLSAVLQDGMAGPLPSSNPCQRRS